MCISKWITVCLYDIDNDVLKNRTKLAFFFAYKHLLLSALRKFCVQESCIFISQKLCNDRLSTELSSDEYAALMPFDPCRQMPAYPFRCWLAKVPRDRSGIADVCFIAEILWQQFILLTTNVIRFTFPNFEVSSNWCKLQIRVGKKGDKKTEQPKINLPGVAEKIELMLCAAMLVSLIYIFSITNFSVVRNTGTKEGQVKCVAFLKLKIRKMICYNRKWACTDEDK